MKTLVLANQKGGVGKSAVATQLAFYLSKLQLRVMVIDLDHQKNSTDPLIQSAKVRVAPVTASQLLTSGGKVMANENFLLVAGDDNLSALERQADKHSLFANHLHDFLRINDEHFDCCILDTNPNPDVRYAASLVVSDFLLAPVQLNQEALSGIGALLGHPRYGFRKIKQTLNPKLDLIGILPNMVEPTPFQRDNFKQLVQSHSQLLILLDEQTKRFAHIPKRSAIAEAQAAGLAIFDMKKTSAREAWSEIKPSFDRLVEHMKLRSPVHA